LWKPGGLAGQWSWFPVGDPDLTLGATTGAGMVSTPNYMATRFPAGLKAGIASVDFGGWQSKTAEKSKVYFSLWVRIRGTTFENQASGTKFGFMSFGKPSTGTRNQGTFKITAGASQGLYSSFQLQFNLQNLVNRILHQNLNTSKLFTVGPWHHLEAVFEINTIGQANGIYKLWIDGVAVAKYTDVMYIDAANPSKFNYWKWNPTWGGVGGVRTRNDYVDIDHVYISGLP
jgi:hypothetical protein